MRIQGRGCKQVRNAKIIFVIKLGKRLLGRP
jgi:hypothetical protein